MRKSYIQFHNYFITNGIFIQPELKAQLVTMSDILGDAIFEKELDEQSPAFGPDRFKKADNVRKEGADLLKEIEKTVYERLWREIPRD